MQEGNFQNGGAQQTGTPAQPPKKKIEFIRNPLPGPKPHVKRTMAYDYDVPPDKMHFDIENPRENDYDYE